MWVDCQIEFFRNVCVQGDSVTSVLELEHHYREEFSHGMGTICPLKYASVDNCRESAPQIYKYLHGIFIGPNRGEQAEAPALISIELLSFVNEGSNFKNKVWIWIVSCDRIMSALVC